MYSIDNIILICTSKLTNAYFVPTSADIADILIGLYIHQHYLLRSHTHNAFMCTLHSILFSFEIASKDL